PGARESDISMMKQRRARAGNMAQACGTTTDSATAAKYPACATNPAIQPMALPLVAVTPTLDTLATPWAVYKIGLYTTPFASVAQVDQDITYEMRHVLELEYQLFIEFQC